MATVRSNIPHGSILAQLRQRQMDEFAAAEQRRKQKASFVNQLSQLGGMAAGAALGTTIFPGMGTAAGMMAGAGMGGTAGGLLGNVVTGTPVSMNQGIGALMQVGGLMTAQDRTAEMAKRTADNLAMDEARLVDYGWTKTLGTGTMQGGITLGDGQWMPPVTENWQDRMAEATALGYESSYTEKAGGGTFKVSSPDQETINIPSGGRLSPSQATKAGAAYDTDAPIKDPVTGEYVYPGTPEYDELWYRMYRVPRDTMSGAYGEGLQWGGFRMSPYQRRQVFGNQGAANTNPLGI